MKKLEIILVVVILIAAFCLRLYKLNSPIADWHSWRQADTAAVARNFIKQKFDIFYPQSDSLTALNEYGLENPNRYFINEFPLYNTLVALLYQNFGIDPKWARLVSITSATLGALFLYLLTRKLFGPKLALLATLFYALNPYNIYYGRVIMPDPSYIALTIGCVYFVLLWTESKKLVYCLTAAILFSAAVLMKPYALFLFIPIFYLMFINWKAKLLNRQTYTFLALALIPFLLWRWHVQNNPEGTFATSWLYNANHIRFSGAFFRWLIFERLNRLIFATGGFVLFILGIVKSQSSKSGIFIFVWLMSVVLYMVIFAAGNVTHDYYQLPIMAPGSILVALGFFALVDYSKNFPSRLINTAIAISLIIISFAFGVFEVRGFFNINHPEIVTAGQRADQLLPKDALVLAPYNDDPTFLYQTNRYGYTAIDRPLSKFLEKGVQYLVSVDLNDSQVQNLSKSCRVVELSSNYVIIELSQKCIST